MTASISFTNLAAKLESITVERVYETDDRTGKRYVAYHTFVRADGHDVRDGAAVEIDFTINLRGKAVSAFSGIRITPKAWKDDLLDLCKSHGVRADRLGVFTAKYIILDPAPLLTPAHDEAALNLKA